MNALLTRTCALLPIAWLVLVQVNVASADIRFCCNNPNDNNNVIKWDNPNVTFKMTSVWTWGLQPVVDAAANLNETLDSAIALTMVNDDDGSVTNNGDGNEVHWSTDAATVPNRLAVTVKRFSNCTRCDSWTCGGTSCTPGRILETDVIFFEKLCVPIPFTDVCSDAPGVPINWTDYPTDLLNATAPGQPNIHAVASHEFLHAVGLEHASNGFARIESHFPGGGWFHATVAPGQRAFALAQDARELSFVYPGADPNIVGVVATNFQHNGAPAELPMLAINHSAPLSFFNATFPDVFPTTLAGLVNPAVARVGRAGDTVLLRVCAQNLGPGTWTEFLPITFRFSTDAVIEATDPVTPDNVGFAANTITGHLNWCADTELHVPAVSPGVYFIGYNFFNELGARAMVLNHTFEVQP